jgi:hypothetical protein
MMEVATILAGWDGTGLYPSILEHAQRTGFGRMNRSFTRFYILRRESPGRSVPEIGDPAADTDFG